MPTLTRDGSIWTIDLGADENRFSPGHLHELGRILDDVRSSTEPAAVVTTGTGKFFSNGLDLDHLAGQPEALMPYVDRIHHLLGAFLTLPVPTVAAVNGHAFGAGAMLALAHDYRVMRSDRGYFCLPEVDIHIPFTAGMASLIQSKTSARTAVDAMTTGRRFGAEDALAAGLVDLVADLDQLPEAAADLVRDLAGKDRATLSAIKATMFASTVVALEPAAPA